MSERVNLLEQEPKRYKKEISRKQTRKGRNEGKNRRWRTRAGKKQRKMSLEMEDEEFDPENPELNDPTSHFYFQPEMCAAEKGVGDGWRG